MEKIDALNNFQIVKELRIDLNAIFNDIEDKMQTLNQLYQEMAKTHQEKIYTIGIDSFHCQNKLIQLEYDNMKNIFNFIDNRIYCEYYKLHRMLFDFINKEIKEKRIVDKLQITYKKYPIYKDLEPTKLYDFNITIEINNAIHNAIQELKEYLSIKKEELTDKKKRTEMGINIHTIIHEQLYNNIILEERINMFESYLHTFISHHSKYFTRLTIKLKLMLGIVNEDFHLKKNKSLENKPLSKDNSSDTSSVSSIATPKSTMNDFEEMTMRLLIGDSPKEIQAELNTILKHIPSNETGQHKRETFYSRESAGVEEAGTMAGAGTAGAGTVEAGTAGAGAVEAGAVEMGDSGVTTI
jgi:hypothetical protein